MSRIKELKDLVYVDPKRTIAKGAQYVREQRRHLGHLRDGSTGHKAVKAAIF